MCSIRNYIYPGNIEFKATQYNKIKDDPQPNKHQAPSFILPPIIYHDQKRPFLKSILSHKKILILIMSWTVYLQNLALLVGLSGLGYGFLQHQKQKYYSELFEQLRKCPKYHLDYVDSISHLPSDKKVLLFGTTNSLNNDKIIARSYLKKSNAENRLWSYEFKNQFKLETASKEYVTVQPGDDNNILAFNLPKGPGQSETHQERVVYHKEPVCIYGMIQNINEGGRRMIPEVLMGTKHEKILQYLDVQMMKFNSRGRFGVILGSVLIGSHFCNKIWQRRAEKQKNMAALLQDKPQQPKV